VGKVSLAQAETHVEVKKMGMPSPIFVWSASRAGTREMGDRLGARRCGWAGWI